MNDDITKCVWAQNDEGQWETECMECFEFTSGSPLENRFEHCPYCGRRLIEGQPEDDGDKTDNGAVVPWNGGEPPDVEMEWIIFRDGGKSYGTFKGSLGDNFRHLGARDFHVTGYIPKR